jgi:hypothetical protein
VKLLAAAEKSGPKGKRIARSALVAVMAPRVFERIDLRSPCRGKDGDNE